MTSPAPTRGLLRHHDLVTFAGFVAGSAALGLIVAIFSYEVFMRYALAAPTTWSSDAVSFLLLISVFLVSPWLAREGGHVAVTLLPDMLPKRPSQLLLRAGYLAGAVVCFWAGYISIGEVALLFDRGTMTLSSFRVPKWILTALITYGLINTGLYFLRLVFAGPARSGDAHA